MNFDIKNIIKKAIKHKKFMDRYYDVWMIKGIIYNIPKKVSRKWKKKHTFGIIKDSSGDVMFELKQITDNDLNELKL